ncbi:MAG: AP2 domain-containing protein [Methylophilaceae bacterium]
MENTLTKPKLINLKNKTKENDDGTTTIFVESKTWGRKEVLIDTEDLLRLDKEIPQKTARGKWSVVVSKDSRSQDIFYAKIHILHPEGGLDKQGRKKTTKLLLHRTILNPSKEKIIDHIDHNGLNNRRENLRICTVTQNAANQRKRKGSSNFKGVYWNKRDQVWRAGIGYKGKDLHLGHFKDELEAAKAYDKAAKDLWGEFANLNFENDYKPQKTITNLKK